MSGDDDVLRDGCPGHGELLELLRGELRAREVHASRDHLECCSGCREELVELAVGHSLLASAGRTLRDPTAVPALQVPERPVPDVRAHTRRRRRLALAGAAAAAVLVTGGAGVASVVTDAAQPPEPPRSPVAASARQADLEPVGRARGRGVVTMAGSRERTAEMTVETRALPRPAEGSYYYVWLLDPDTDKMLPIGQVDAQGSTTFRLPLSLLGRYSAIDVSLETDDGDPGHSPTSVLRASYAPPSTTGS